MGFQRCAQETFPDFAWGEGNTDLGEEDALTRSSPLRLCDQVFFYRLSDEVRAGFVADILGQLTNGWYFYYREGPPAVGDGGIGRCANYCAVVAKSLRGVVGAMRDEDRYDVLTRKELPRVELCECMMCRHRTRRS